MFNVQSNKEYKNDKNEHFKKPIGQNTKINKLNKRPPNHTEINKHQNK